jgi:Ti-type conjugative transfer relaxase TraA
MEVVKAGSGSSAVGLSTYITRGARTDQTNGDSFNFQHKEGELVATGTSLPDGSPEWAKNGETLWNRATTAELTIDRRTRETRFKKNAQIAKHYVFALPKEITDEERIELTENLARELFSDEGVAVEWAIHRPDEDSSNDHAHLLVSTRRLGAKGFGTKARELNPGFSTKDGRHFLSEQQHWEHRWTEFQNRFFREKGIELEVDPFKVIPETTKGKSRFVAEAEKVAENADRKSAAAIAIQEVEVLLDAATERAATFTRQDLKRVLKVHGVVGADADVAVESALRSHELLALMSKDTGVATGRFTTRAVRDQEDRTLTAVRAIADRAPVVVQPNLVHEVAARLTMDVEQTSVLSHAANRSFSIIQGDAGTGKSHAIRGLREVLERSGIRVVGAAPTNTVAADMRKDGFRSADTLHATLGQLDRGDMMLDRRSALIVDEAAMTGSAILQRLTQHCASSGAALHIVGDDKQLASIARGGLYSVLRAEHGDAQLTGVRRQHADWMKQASRDFAAGRAQAAIDAYDDHDCIRWSDTTQEAREQLLDAWAATPSSDHSTRFIYASTNAAVDDLNQKARASRLAQSEIEPGAEFMTVRGKVAVAVGDRVQMHGNLKRAGIYNGTVATVERLRPDGSLDLRFDDGRTALLPSKFKDWGLGYAGTVYRGQGKTQQDVFALYDSHMGWNAQATYVAGTRHKATFRMFVPRDLAADRTALIKQTSRSSFKEASLVYAAVPMNGLPQQEKANAKSARTHDFRKPASGQPRPVGKSRADPVAGQDRAPQPRHGLRKLSGIPVDGLRRRPSVLLPNSPRVHLDDGRTDRARGLRRPDHDVAQQSAASRVAEIELEQELDRALERRHDAEQREDWAEAGELTYGVIPVLENKLTAIAPAAVGRVQARHARGQFLHAVSNAAADADEIRRYINDARRAPNRFEGGYFLRQLAAAFKGIDQSPYIASHRTRESALDSASKAALETSRRLDALLDRASADPRGDRQRIDRMKNGEVQAYYELRDMGLVSRLRGGAITGRDERKAAIQAAESVAGMALDLRACQAAVRVARSDMKEFDHTHVEAARLAAWLLRVTKELQAEMFGLEAAVTSIAEKIERRGTVDHLLGADMPDSHKVARAREIDDAASAERENGQTPG